MNDILKAVILGIIEGLTEFIPVSSTGHLILTGHFLEFERANAATFDIAIQLGAILAVVVLYRDVFTPFLTPKNWASHSAKIIAIAIAPALTLGFLLYPLIKSLFSPEVVITALFIGGIIMIAIEKWLPQNAKTTDIDAITPKQALLIGVCQCASLWPGMSRSGSTIVGGLIAKLDHETAAKFSFIIAVPVMVAAVSYDLLKSAAQLTAYDVGLIAIGFVVSFIVAIGAIVSFLKLLNRFKLIPFGVYRIILSAIIAAILF